ncbi:universal stress protein [Nocardia aurantiaca]|uniref:Universal stress protein n=1 Tax=Nocardia aurantiaca TaxID=2675850 RepID=A0A6I3L2Y8_9NOCA|nr:universal stress protein [Nocardia aurantiaca]MTE15230.1 universal stress protein [Nocardia aurantiaca]
MTELEYEDPHRLVTAAVVVGVDGSPGSDIALRWAADLAARRGRELQIIHGLDLVGTSAVLGPYAVVTPEVIDTARAHGQTVLRNALGSVRAVHPGLRATAHLYNDSAAGLLIDYSARAYVVVLGATGNSGTLAHLGSTLLSVTAHAKGNVIVVRPDPDADNTVRDSGPVVVGIDCGPVSEPAIAAAFAEASERGADLVAVHVWSDWSAGMFAGDHPTPVLDDVEAVEESVLAERLAGWQEKYPDVAVSRRVYFSAPAAQLQEWSKHAQLIVVGNRGRGGFVGLLLGSTAHSLVQHAHSPVMVVHPAE